MPASVETVRIKGIPTNVLRSDAERPQALVLVVPGNPGIARVYQPFVERLAVLGRGQLSVAVAAHAGHTPGHRADGGFFNLAYQLAHHQAFLASLPDSPKIHVVGHSIGAWLALHLFDALPATRRGQAVLLFPTIERMAQTPAGRTLAPIFSTFRPVAVSLCDLISRFPARKHWLDRWLLADATDEERPIMQTGLMELSGISMRNVLLMAREELATVIERPAHLLKRHAENLTLYYGRNDPWNLPDMPDDLERHFPVASVVRCEQGISHSFMFGGSHAMAEFVADLLCG